MTTKHSEAKHSAIKHLVISGGGPTGLYAYGVAAQLARKKFWHLTDIISIYGCSIGAYMGVVFSLGYEWAWLDDYFIKRPWEKLAASATMHFTEIYEKKGIINEMFLNEAILPLLKAKELSENITLQELYDYNKIDIHMYATNINTQKLTKLDLSHTTHPDLLLIKALRMTMSFPIIFEPIFEEENCYIDGGLLNNFSLNDCLTQQQCEPSEILAFKNIYTDIKQTINAQSSIFDFLFCLIKKMQATLDTAAEQKEEDVKHIVHCFVDDLSGFDKWSDALSSEEKRKTIVKNGSDQADAFLLGLD
jgi:NTE family protein